MLNNISFLHYTSKRKTFLITQNTQKDITFIYYLKKYIYIFYDTKNLFDLIEILFVQIKLFCQLLRQYRIHSLLK